MEQWTRQGERERTLDRLEWFRRDLVGRENWDSYGAAPLTHSAIDALRAYLEARPELYLPELDVSPHGDGGVSAEWWDPDRAPPEDGALSGATMLDKFWVRTDPGGHLQELHVETDDPHPDVAAVLAEARSRQQDLTSRTHA